MTFAELTQAALLGTERQSLASSPETTLLGRLQGRIDLGHRERALLSLAALTGPHERIGSPPAGEHAPSLAACPPESRAWVGDRAGALLRRLLTGDCAEVLPEWLELAASGNLVAPPEAVPALLELGSSKADWRERVLAVLGERGRWLAAQNPTWAWVGGVDEDESVWQLGESSARLLFLRRQRQRDPARGLELLLETWPEEAPEERATFLAALETGLSCADEPFLESVLEDKRKEVRRLAADLLGRLPDSALVRRQTERSMAWLRYAPAGIEVELPSACDKGMQHDGVEPKPPRGVGEKAWWLTQTLEVAPLEGWTRAWHCSAEEIIEASRRSEWSEALLEGWSRAATRQHNELWADALLAVAREAKLKIPDLLAALPPARREARLAEWLSRSDEAIRETQTALLLQCRHAWSPAFSRTALAFLRVRTAQESADWQCRNQLKDLATRLAPEVLAEAFTGWPTDASGWEYWSEGMDRFLAVVQFRADLHAAFPGNP